VGTDIFLQRATHRGPLGTPAWEQIPVDEFAGLEPPAAPRDAAGERLALQRRLLRDLLQAIAEDRAPESSGHAARQALELSMAVWESQREGRPVALPLGNRAHPLERWRSSAP
jgi:predicted dehydrogenase